MTFFFMKNPSFLEFFTDSTCSEEPRKLQIRNKIVDGDVKSNTKLCKRADGTWFIKCGNIKMDLKSTPIKHMKVGEKNEKGGKIIGFVTKKWFIKMGSDLKEIYKN